MPEQEREQGQWWQLVIGWGDDNPLVTRLLAPGDCFHIGDAAPGAPVDFSMDASDFGGGRWCLVNARGELCLPPDADTGGRASNVPGIDIQTRSDAAAAQCAQLHEFVIWLLPANAPKRSPFPVGAALLKPGLLSATVLASLSVHALFLLLGYFLPPSASALSLDMDHAQLDRAHYLLTPVEHVEPPPEWTEDPGGDAGEPGAAHSGEPGQAGDDDAPKTQKRGGTKGPKDNPDPTLAKPALRDAAENQGMLGVLARAVAQLGPQSPFGPEVPVGYDAMSAIGALYGSDIGANFGIGGLAPRGTGRGGGGNADGTRGTGPLGTRGGPGYGDGVPVGRGIRTGPPPPKIRTHIEVTGSLSKEMIRRTITRNRNQMRHCYEQGLRGNASLEGRVRVFFLIGPDGAVMSASLKDSSMHNARVEQCVVAAVRRLGFPQPRGGGLVKVTYPFSFQSSP